MISAWQDDAMMPKFPTLSHDAKTDVLIIGGGICGVLCAHQLSLRNIDYMLVEGAQIGAGITKNTSAKITSQHGLIYDRLIAKVGFKMAKQYLDANEAAIRDYRELCKNIDCDFENKSAYTYSIANKTPIEKEVRAARALGKNAEYAERINLPFETQGAIEFGDQAQFNPLKFMANISKGLNIFENTFVKSVLENVAFTSTHKIAAKTIVVATHFPFINTHGGYFAKLFQHRSYVIALENAAQIDGMYIDAHPNGMSYRNYQNLLLLIGGGHKTGKQGTNWKELRDFAAQYYPNATEKYAWATQDCMSLDGIPYIGSYSKSMPKMLVATGFNKWGITTAMAAAKILCDTIIAKQNEFAEVFLPQRHMAMPQLFLNGAAAAVNLLNPKTKRCPHMGCALKWNKIEHTWDCPCHGSRFAESGGVIDNPATGGVNIG